MNIYQAKEKAKDDAYNSKEFIAHFPIGPVKCKWLDAYLGLFVIDGQNGFVSVKDVDANYPDLIVDQA